MDCRVQMLFLNQGTQSSSDPREAYIVLGFLGINARAPRSAGRAILAFRGSDNGSIGGTLQSVGPWPQLDTDSNSYQLSELCTSNIWHRSSVDDHPRGLILGDILYRPTMAMTSKHRYHAFIGVLMAHPDAKPPHFHHRYDFEVAGEAFAAAKPTLVPALDYIMGVTPNHYLQAPGWQLGRPDLAGLQSTLGIDAITSYDRFNRMEMAGEAPETIEDAVRGTVADRRHVQDKAFNAWRPLYREELENAGIRNHSLLMPLTAAEMEARERAASRAMDRLMVLRNGDI